MSVCILSCDLRTCSTSTPLRPEQHPNVDHGSPPTLLQSSSPVLSNEPQESAPTASMPGLAPQTPPPAVRPDAGAAASGVPKSFANVLRGMGSRLTGAGPASASKSTPKQPASSSSRCDAKVLQAVAARQLIGCNCAAAVEYSTCVHAATLQGNFSVGGSCSAVQLSAYSNSNTVFPTAPCSDLVLPPLPFHVLGAGMRQDPFLERRHPPHLSPLVLTPPLHSCPPPPEQLPMPCLARPPPPPCAPPPLPSQPLPLTAALQGLASEALWARSRVPHARLAHGAPAA